MSEPQLGSVASSPVDMKSEEASGPGVNPWAVVGILIGVLVVALPCIFIAVRKVVKRGPFDHLRIVDDIPDSMPGERIDPDKVVFGPSLGRGTSGEDTPSDWECACILICKMNGFVGPWRA